MYYTSQSRVCIALIFEKSRVYRVDIRKVRCKWSWYQIYCAKCTILWKVGCVSCWYSKSHVYIVLIIKTSDLLIWGVHCVDMRCTLYWYVHRVDRYISCWYIKVTVYSLSLCSRMLYLTIYSRILYEKYTLDRTASCWYTVNFSNELNDSEISEFLNSEFKIRSNSKLMVYSEVSSELNDSEISEFWILNSIEQQAYGI